MRPQRDDEEWDLDYFCFCTNRGQTSDAEVGFMKERNDRDRWHVDFEGKERLVEAEIVQAKDEMPMSPEMQDLMEGFSRCRAS